MGGIFGVVSKADCVNDLFYGTDYHSHLGTRRGGLAVLRDRKYKRLIHNIETTQFRSKFEDDIPKMAGNMGIGCISDTEDQPLIISSHLGKYAIVTVGRVNNVEDLVKNAFVKRTTHFSEMGGGEINATELVSTLINQGGSFEDGIRIAQEAIDGSCSLLLLSEQGLYAARDRFGRTPLLIGEREGAFCASLESCAFINLGYRLRNELGPGEIVRLEPEGVEPKAPAFDRLRICAFLWVYYGYPASIYEGRNVEVVRNRCGAALARSEDMQFDMVAGVPDSGTAHAIGYANEAGIPFQRPFVKYTPTWPRSFMPRNQAVRDLVARMKLIPIQELIQDKRLLLCEDSIVRGTQLREIISRLFEFGAKEVHMRPACPPLIFGCRFLNFSRSRPEVDLVSRRAIRDLENRDDAPVEEYADPCSDKHCAMVRRIREKLGLTSLRYQSMPELLEAIDLPPEKVCTYCWTGDDQ